MDTFIHSFIPLACAECDDSLPFSRASSIPLCYVLFPATLLHQLFFHPLAPHLFLGLPLNLVVPKFIYNALLGILFSSTLCTCRNQRNLFNLIISIIVRFLTLALISLLVNILQFSFSLSYTGPKILLYTFLSKMFTCFLSLFVSVQVSDAMDTLSLIKFLIRIHLLHLYPITWYNK